MTGQPDDLSTVDRSSNRHPRAAIFNLFRRSKSSRVPTCRHTETVLKVIDSKTYWEVAAETAWGRYLTGVERRVLSRAIDIAPQSGDVMDVGCEGGRWSKYLIERRGSVISTDIDPEVLDLCAGRFPEATCILAKPGDERLPASDESLALLLAFEVAPVTNAAWFPLEARRALRPDGILVMSYYNSLSLRAVFYRALALVDRSRRATSYYRGPTYVSFRRSLSLAGFTFVHQEGLAWAPFRRQSDSRWVSLAADVERALGLRRLASISPWVLLVARRTATAAAPGG